MTICLFVSHGFLLNLGITKNCSLNCELQYPVYLATAAFLLIISALPFSFFVGLYVVTIIIFGETFDVSSRSCTEMPLLFPILYLSFGVLLSYPCARLLELHHPGFLFSMLIRSKRLMTTIQIVDITGKPHTLPFAPYATIKDLRSQINTKFRITSDLYWLSCCGKPLFDFLLLEEIRGTVFMHGRLMGGVQCCLKGCENEAGSRKFDSMVGRYELKCAPDDVTPENLKDLRVCDKHYGSLSARGHKPPKGKSSTRSRSDAQLGILKVTPCIVPCSQCGNKVCLSSDVPCKKHHINIFKNTFSVGCNFLDERTGNKTDLHNDLYSVDPCDGTFPDYICMSCQPFYLKSIKIEHEYKEAQNIFHQKQGCSISTITTDNDSNKHEFFEETTINPTKGQATVLSEKMVLDREFAVSDALNCKAGIFTDVLNEIMTQTAPKEPVDAGNDSEVQSSPLPVYTVFQTIISCIFPWTVSFTQHTTDNTMKVTFSLPNIGKGGVITKWKEITLFLPSEIKTFPSKDFSPFTVEFLGNKIDHGELPHNIFQENILNSALGVMLKTIENLPVCPGIYDPALVDMAERKRETNLYFVDEKGANVDGEIVKCFWSLNCTYKLPVHSKTRCHKCQDILRSCFRWKTNPSSESFESKTAYDSHTKLSTLSRAELIARAKNLHKVVAQSQKKAKRYYSLYLKEKQKNVKAPKNFQPKSSDLAKLMDVAIENHWLVENSVLFALLTDTLTSLKKQEEEFAKQGKLTKNKQKPHPKGMRYNPLVIKWSCMIASKCHKKGYEVVRSILSHLLSKVTHLRGTHQKIKSWKNRNNFRH